MDYRYTLKNLKLSVGGQPFEIGELELEVKSLDIKDSIAVMRAVPSFLREIKEIFEEDIDLLAEAGEFVEGLCAKHMTPETAPTGVNHNIYKAESTGADTDGDNQEETGLSLKDMVGKKIDVEMSSGEKVVGILQSINPHSYKAIIRMYYEVNPLQSESTVIKISESTVIKIEDIKSVKLVF